MSETLEDAMPLTDQERRRLLEGRWPGSMMTTDGVAETLHRFEATLQVDREELIATVASALGFEPGVLTDDTDLERAIEALQDRLDEAEAEVERLSDLLDTADELDAGHGARQRIIDLQGDLEVAHAALAKCNTKFLTFMERPCDNEPYFTWCQEMHCMISDILEAAV